MKNIDGRVATPGYKNDALSPSSGLKKARGQFFTVTNPFTHVAFAQWAQHARLNEQCVLEPFAGANNIIKMLDGMGLIQEFKSFDIEPKCKNVKKKDTLASFPKGFDVCVTNPPYLARNSARRDGIGFPVTEYDDLYKYALGKCLDNCGYVAAIIPETFIVSRLFHSRLTSFVSLTCTMFEDTDHPVGLAMFEPTSNDISIYSNNYHIGMMSDLEAKLPRYHEGIDFRFNDPAGEIGLRGYDGQSGPSIQFCTGSNIRATAVKPSSRHNTRISLLGSRKKRDIIPGIIHHANEILSVLRKETGDVFLTAHRGLRSDGQYRRRLGFGLARNILTEAAIRAGV